MKDYNRNNLMKCTKKELVEMLLCERVNSYMLETKNKELNEALDLCVIDLKFNLDDCMESINKQDYINKVRENKNHTQFGD